MVAAKTNESIKGTPAKSIDRISRKKRRRRKDIAFAEMLHDEVGALLSFSRIFLVEMNTNNLSEDDKQDHAKVKEMIDESIQKVRTISHNLHSTILKEFGLNEAIRHFMKKIRAARL
jgi:signal transduction histidine kinase